MNVAGTGSDSALLGDGEERSGLIDPDRVRLCRAYCGSRTRDSMHSG